MEKAEKVCGKVYPIELNILLPTSDTLIPLNIPTGINKIETRNKETIHDGAQRNYYMKNT